MLRITLTENHSQHERWTNMPMMDFRVMLEPGEVLTLELDGLVTAMAYQASGAWAIWWCAQFGARWIGRVH
jgi:hypothetical protein